MFLDKVILISLIAIAVPVILHLLNLQKVQKIEFSTLMFVKEFSKTRYRKLRIKNLLLLLIRAAIIALIVFTFAEPFMKGNASGSNARKLGILFVDSSYSMSGTESNSRISEISSRIKSLFSSSDEVAALTTSVQSDTSEKFIAVRPNLSSIINKTKEISGKYDLSVSEVFVISDLQKVNFHDLRYNSGIKSHYYIIQTSDNGKPNISLSNIQITSKLFGISFPIKFKVTVRNHTDNFVQGVNINVYSNDISLDTRMIDLKPSEIKELEFSYKPISKGINTIKAVMIPSEGAFDSFKEDNEFYRKIFIPEAVSIGIISPSNETAKYIRAVFDAANKSTEGGNIYKYELTKSLEGMEKFDVVYLCGFSNFTNEELNIINNFSKSGKGLVVFPPLNADIESYNKIGGNRILSQENNGFDSEIAEINSENPILFDIFKNSGAVTNVNPDFGKIKINAIYKPVLSTEGIELISIKNAANNSQIPLIYTFATEPLTFANVSADLEMSDFPLHSLFAPFILRTAHYTNTFENYNSMLQISNHDTLESNPELINPSVLNTTLKLSGIEDYDIITPDNSGNLEEIIRQNRTGKSLWYIPLILAILLLPVEIYLSKRKSESQ